MTEIGSIRSARADAAATTSDRRRIALLVGVLGIVAVLMGLVAWQGVRLATATADRDARDDLRAAAGVIVGQVLSYGSRREEARVRARGLVTDAYARRSGLDQQQPALVTDTEMIWAPTMVGIVDADSATGTALIDGTLTRVAMGVRNSTPQTLQAEFVSRGGRWLVDRIDVMR